MVDQPSPDPRKRKVENATEHGRYGKAPEGRPHVEPEVPPLTSEGAKPEGEVETVGGATVDRAGEEPPARAQEKE